MIESPGPNHQGDVVNMKSIGWLVCLLAVSLPHQAWSKDKEARRAVLQSCAQQAKDQSLTGDTHAAFMRDCLKMPADAKPPAFASSEPQKAVSAATTDTAPKPVKKPRKGG
jgi:hypothetical protein